MSAGLAERLPALLALGGAGLRAALEGGHPVAPEALDDSRYLGVSLGLPGFVDALLWKTFMKTFRRDPASGALRGWNVRLEQTGWEGPPVPKIRRGRPVTFGHYAVVPAPQGTPRTPSGALLLDYGAGGNPALDPAGLLRDPVVALEAGGVDLLLGWTYAALGPLAVPTPSYFLLSRVGPLDHDAAPSGAGPR